MFLNNGAPPGGSGGNPALLPYIAYNFQATATWYFAPQSALAFEAFAINTHNYIENVTRDETHFNPFKVTAPATFAKLVTEGFCQENGNCTYQIARPHNVATGHIRGLSVAYQQPFGQSGFGMIANFMVTSSGISSGGPLPGASHYSYHLSPYFSSGPFDARLTYNWRSKFLTGQVQDALGDSENAYSAGFASLGLHLTWNFTKHMSASLDGLNLTDHRLYSYMGRPRAVNGIYYNGRVLIGKIHFRF